MTKGLAGRAPDSEERASIIEIGQRCEKRRLDLGLIRHIAADKAGIDASSLYRFEKGKQALSIPKMIRLAKVLEISLDELVKP